AADLLRHAADAGTGAEDLPRTLALQRRQRGLDAGRDRVHGEGIGRLAQQHFADAMRPAEGLRRLLGQHTGKARAMSYGGVTQAEDAPGHSAALLKNMRVLS